MSERDLYSFWFFSNIKADFFTDGTKGGKNNSVHAQLQNFIRLSGKFLWIMFELNI